MRPPPRDDLRFSNTTSILPNTKTTWFIGVEVDQETSAPPPKKNPGSAPDIVHVHHEKSSQHTCCGSVLSLV